MNIYCLLLFFYIFLTNFWHTDGERQLKSRPPLIPYPLHDFFQVDPVTEEFIRSLAGPGYLPDAPAAVSNLPGLYSNAVLPQNGYPGYYYPPNTSPNKNNILNGGYFSINGNSGSADIINGNNGFTSDQMPKFDKFPVVAREYLPENSFVIDNNNEFDDAHGQLAIDSFYKNNNFLPTTTPGWTRATTTKDTLVAYFEQTLDKFLSQGFAARKRVPLPNYLEEDMLLMNNKKVRIILFFLNAS